jgi:hypothetical protein
MSHIIEDLKKITNEVISLLPRAPANPHRSLQAWQQEFRQESDNLIFAYDKSVRENDLKAMIHNHNEASKLLSELIVIADDLDDNDMSAINQPFQD